MNRKKQVNPLWTKDFTIITLGSAVSMIGNAMSGFAMSLLVLDYTQSTLLYAIYLAVYNLPQIFVPVLSGAFLDRFSRRKTIYTLDFISAVNVNEKVDHVTLNFFTTMTVKKLAIFCIYDIQKVYHS